MLAAPVLSIIEGLVLTVTLGISTTILGPGDLPDSPAVALNSSYYLSNGETYRYSDNWQPLGVALARGPAGAFDSCGAWLMGAYEDETVVRGWYHAEGSCPIAYQETRKTIAYAESYDGGASFTKLGQIISAPGYIPDTLYDDEGDFSIVVNGDYFYLYFLASRDGRTHLARSLISSGGGPGTWVKWYQGSFSEPGLGGESDPLTWQWEFQTPWVTWNSYLGRYIALNRRRGGWALSISEDGLNWQGLDCLIVPDAGVQAGDRATAQQRLVDYMKFVGEGQAVDLYYMELKPHEGFDKRYLIQQAVEFEGGGDDCAVQQVMGLWLPVVRN